MITVMMVMMAMIESDDAREHILAYSMLTSRTLAARAVLGLFTQMFRNASRAERARAVSVAAPQQVLLVLAKHAKIVVIMARCISRRGIDAAR